MVVVVVVVVTVRNTFKRLPMLLDEFSFMDRSLILKNSCWMAP
jgi:hypothetical protein